jgi:hypothetical protein
MQTPEIYAQTAPLVERDLSPQVPISSFKPTLRAVTGKTSAPSVLFRRLT